MCAGPESRNLNVIFSGEATLSSALTVAFQQQATALGKSLSETRLLKPFSADAGLHTGLQFISLGGSNAAGAFSNETLHGAGFTPKGLASVKAAGFSGICFDVEVTEGAADTLAAALEAAFVACKKAGMLVMVTTSHTAPFAAATDHTKRLLVDSWVNSSSIDIFSPQLYTSGYEPRPQFELTPCLPTDTLFESRCSWERLKKMKAMWVPSLSSAEHYPAAEEFFAKLDIQTRGFVQWKDPDDPKLPVIPDELNGYYLKAWNLAECKPNDTPMVCSGEDKMLGLKNKNINVVFSGAANMEKALKLALREQQKALEEDDIHTACKGRDQRMCDRLVKDRQGNEGMSRADGILAVTAPGEYTAEQCKPCFLKELNIKVASDEAPSEALFSRPFSREAGLHKGLQFLAVGGATDKSKFSVDLLKAALDQVEAVKAAGFDGVTFDIERTNGGGEALAAAFTDAFAACKQAGLLVMVSTSHSAPWDAPDGTKEKIVDAWVRSPDVDIFSPQLYTMGYEAEPSFEQTPCGGGDSSFKSKCSWERLKSMRAKWVPSLSNALQYPNASAYFAELDITTQGFVQWRDPEGELGAEVEPKFINPRDVDRYLMPNGPG